MGEPASSDVRVRLALRVLGWVGTTLWASMWLMWGLTVALLPGNGVAAAVLAGIGCIPCLPFWIVELRRFRRWRTAQAAGAREARQPLPQDRVAAEQFERLPASIRGEWRRLEHARDLVVGFAEDGWVEPAALLHVDDHVARLERLLEADARVSELGGVPSETLRRQVEELTALLVALADQAVEHQASLASDDPVPVTLAEARERLATTTQAYRELRSPEVARNVQQPG
ncbi:MAG TPA: hypothetical protein VK891_12605 [Euzebyales bacterium]|nr:hypothetical protein [Euzebyales bacterium]